MMIGDTLTPQRLELSAQYKQYKIFTNTGMIEKAFNSSISVGELKFQLELMVGIKAYSMKLKANGQYMEDHQCIGPFSEFEVSGKQIQFDHVEKMEMADEEYDKRRDTVRSFKKQNQLGRFKPETAEPEEKCGFAVGSRCQVKGRRGEIKFVGSMEGKPGEMVGVQLDEPTGIHNGTILGKTYFSCPPKCGILVRPSQVEVGDFPELNDLFDDEF